MHHLHGLSATVIKLGECAVHRSTALVVEFNTTTLPSDKLVLRMKRLYATWLLTAVPTDVQDWWIVCQLKLRELAQLEHLFDIDGRAKQGNVGSTVGSSRCAHTTTTSPATTFGMKPCRQPGPCHRSVGPYVQAKAPCTATATISIECVRAYTSFWH